MKNNNILIILFLAAASFVILAYNINKPFWGHHDFNNAFYGNMARNLLRYSVWETKLGQITSSGTTTAANFSYHTHHPPLIIWMMAGTYAVLGIGEWQTRIVPIFFSVGTVSLFYLLLSNVLGRRVALIACTFWIITPLFFYFGKLADEIIVLFFVILSLYLYQRRKFKWLYFSVLLGSLTAWAGFYTVLIIALFELLSSRRLSPRLIFLFLIPVSVFIFQLAQTYILTGSAFGKGLLKSFLLRTSPIPIGDFLRQEVSWIMAYFTKPIVISSIAGGLLAAKKKQYFVLALLLYGVIHPLVFRQSAYHHDYLIYYLLPFITASAAYFLVSVIGSSRFLLAAVALVIVITSTAFSLPFTRALILSDYAKPGVDIGRMIFEKTGENARVLVVSPKIYNKFDWQVVFYGNRSVFVSPTPISTDNFNYLVEEKDTTYKLAPL